MFRVGFYWSKKRHNVTSGFWYFYLVALNVCPDMSVKHLGCSHAFAIPLSELSGLLLFPVTVLSSTHFVQCPSSHACSSSFTLPLNACSVQSKSLRQYRKGVVTKEKMEEIKGRSERAVSDRIQAPLSDLTSVTFS